MGFAFRLEKVLNHRRFLLETARQAWQAARLLERQARRRVQDLEQRIQTAEAEWQARQRNGMDVATFLAYKDHIRDLARQLPQLRQEQQLASDEVERRRQLLLEREQAMKVLEKLRDRCFQDYTLECARNDQKKLDETVIIKTHRDAEDV
ncbi:MAG: flagellar export protein FliJ [Syntrophobacteraceae bacterium CG2_30_61_12]|nr:MAG: flagellar export protein FliJ [Syntrophobacteraceae bacterium CG2_30_61_12]PIU31028.1 MAG: flagellar export protein FliJ [Syntrophobacteraceae bacterium CG07_land_8_20_14_0_80_61_8]